MRLSIIWCRLNMEIQQWWGRLDPWPAVRRPTANCEYKAGWWSTKIIVYCGVLVQLACCFCCCGESCERSRQQRWRAHVRTSDLFTWSMIVLEKKTNPIVMQPNWIPRMCKIGVSGDPLNFFVRYLSRAAQGSYQLILKKKFQADFF